MDDGSGLNFWMFIWGISFSKVWGLNELCLFLDINEFFMLLLRFIFLILFDCYLDILGCVFSLFFVFVFFFWECFVILWVNVNWFNFFWKLWVVFYGNFCFWSIDIEWEVMLFLLGMDCWLVDWRG